MAVKAAEVIASVIDSGEIHTIVGLDEKIFGSHGDLFLFVRDYYMRHKSVPDRAVIKENFGDIDLPNVKGASAYYVEAMCSEYVKMRIQVITTKAAKNEENFTPAQTLNNLLTSLSRLGQYTTSAKDLSLKDIGAAEEYFERLRAQSELNGGTPGISTGFDTIDSAYTTGMSGGHAITLMGYSGKGKSMFSGLIGVNAWIQGKKVMVISLEMTPEEYRERIYTMMGHGRFSLTKMGRGDVDPDDFREWARKNLADSTDFIVVSSEGNSSITPHTIQAKIDLHRPDLVILDYLQLMSDNAKTGDMTRRMLNLSREIKLLAVAANIPIISITAVTDEDNDKRDAPPLVSQVAWSKGIEYDSNVIISIHRHTDTNIVEVVGRKNRHGELFSMFFEVDFDAGIWQEKFDL